MWEEKSIADGGKDKNGESQREKTRANNENRDIYLVSGSFTYTRLTRTVPSVFTIAGDRWS